MTTNPDPTCTSVPPAVPLPVPVDETTASPTAPVGTGPGLPAQFTQLHRELDDARYDTTRLRQRLRAAEDAHRADIAAIGQALIAEADERDWCTEYDDFVERLNEKLNVELAIRMKAWEVIVPMLVRVRVAEARTPDEAVDRAGEIAVDLESWLRRDDAVITAYIGSHHDFEANQADD